MSGRTADTLTHAEGMRGVVGRGQATTGSFRANALLPFTKNSFSVHSSVGHPRHWQWMLQRPRELSLVSAPRRSLSGVLLAAWCDAPGAEKALSDAVLAAWFDAPGAEMAVALPTVRIGSANPVVPGTAKKHERDLLKWPKSIVRLIN